MPAKGGAATPTKLRLAERRSRAAELRKSGLSYSEIADVISAELGNKSYRIQQAHKDVHYVLSQLREKTSDDAQDILDMELMRLDEMFSRWWTAATRVDSPDSDSEYSELNDRRTAVLKAALSKAIAALQRGDLEPSTWSETLVTVRDVVRELRTENLFPQVRTPDKDAAQVILNIIEKRSRLLGLDKLVISGDPDRPLETVATARIEELSEEDLEQLVQNLAIAVGTDGADSAARVARAIEE